jgi:hypothetical protein
MCIADIMSPLIPPKYMCAILSPETTCCIYSRCLYQGCLFISHPPCEIYLCKTLLEYSVPVIFRRITAAGILLRAQRAENTVTSVGSREYHLMNKRLITTKVILSFRAQLTRTTRSPSLMSVPLIMKMEKTLSQ